MRSERGQATVEWIGILLLIALALAALSRLAPHGDDHALASTLTHSITHPVFPDSTPKREVVRIRIEKRPDSPPPAARAFTVPPPVPDVGRRAFTAPPLGRHVDLRAFVAPPLVPHAGLPRGSGHPRLPDLRALLPVRPGAPIRLPDAPAVLRRARRGAGAAWRRAWYACLVYERFRWAFLHPESRFPGYTMPPAEVLRIMNDCVSPVDLVRDWPMLRNGVR